MAAKSAAPLSGSVGDYDIVERIATAEFSTTYKARHAVTGELAFVKVPTPVVVQNPVLLKRFEQEFTLTRGLDHPQLVHALGRGFHGETPYIVLEYVDGPSLGARIERAGPLPQAEALAVITQVGEALHFAHQHRIIHRNVKPDNILLAADGTAKLADLGLAKDYELDVCLTRPSSGLGTPNFMAPEQFQDARSADRRCDIYSLAATLYMALTGELPFRARGLMSILKKKLERDLTQPRQLVPSLAPCVEAAILRALDLNPKARHATCTEFIDEIHGRGAPAIGATEAQAQAPAALVPSDAEQRATARYPSHLDGFCQTVEGKKAGCWEAVVQDVSADGLGIVVNRRFEPRTVLLLELNPTPESPARRVLVRVVRVRRLAPHRWLLGCDFGVRLNAEEVQRLR